MNPNGTSTRGVELGSVLANTAVQPTDQPAAAVPDLAAILPDDQPSSTGGLHTAATLSHMPHVQRPKHSRSAPTDSITPQRGRASLQESLQDSSEPARDLADVSYRLKKLEKAVKLQLNAPRSAAAGDVSILSSVSGGTASGTQQSSVAAGSSSPAACPKLSERSRLRDALSVIKADVADLAAREVEVRLLQQRVARLEAAIGGYGFGHGFLVTGLGSSGGGTAGHIPGSPSLRADASSRPRTPSDVSVLTDRLGDVEGLLKELATVQVANTAALQEIGIRLQPSPVPQAPLSPGHGGVPYAMHHAMADATRKSFPFSPVPPRPPSCPNIGPLSQGLFGSPPMASASYYRRAPSPDLYYSYPAVACHPSYAPFASFSVHTHSPKGPVHAGSNQPAGSNSGCAPDRMSHTHSGMQPPEQPNGPQQQQQQQEQQAELLEPAQHQLFQLQQQQQHVEAMLSSHDAELAAVKHAIKCITDEQHEAAGEAGSTALQLNSLLKRVTAGETAAMVATAASARQEAAAALEPHVATAAGSLGEGQASQTRANQVDLSAILPGLLNQADVVEAIEGLSADVGEADSRLEKLEGMNKQLQSRLEEVDNQTDLLKEQTGQALTSIEQLSSRVLELEACSTAAVGTAVSSIVAGRLTDSAVAATKQIHELMLSQLLTSSHLQQLVDSRVEQLLHSRVAEVVAARLADTTAGAAAATTAPRSLENASGLAVSDAVTHSAHLLAQALSFSEDGEGLRTETSIGDWSAARTSQSSDAHDKAGYIVSYPSARVSQSSGAAGYSASQPSTPKVPSQLQAAFDELANRMCALQAQAAAGQAEVIQEALQHMNNRLQHVEELVQQQQQQQQWGEEASEMQQESEIVVHQLAAAPGILAADAQLDHLQPAPELMEDSNHTANESSLHADPQALPLLAEESVAGAAPVQQQTLSKQPSTSSVIGRQDSFADASSSSVQSHVAVAAPTAAAGAAAGSRACSMHTDTLERQMAALQLEMAGHQLQALQASVDELNRQVASLQQQQVQQAAMLDQQRASSAAGFAVLNPLEPQVATLAGQVAAMQSVLAARQQSDRFDALQQEIQQLSRQLAEVNEGAADESELEEIKGHMSQLTQQQLQLQSGVESHIRRLHEAITAIATSKEADGQAEAEPAAGGTAAIESRLLALENLVHQRLTTVQGLVAELQQHVELKIDEVTAGAQEAAAAAASQSTASDVLAAQMQELTGQLATLEAAVGGARAAAQTELASKVDELKAAAETQDAELSGQLSTQVDTMAQILAEVGQTKARQDDVMQQLKQQLDSLFETHAASEAQQAELSAHIQELASSLRSELGGALQPVQEQLTSHKEAIESCAKSAVVTGAVATLRTLSGTVESLGSRVDELAQVQRTVEGQLNAAQEHRMALNEQLGGLQRFVQDVADGAGSLKYHMQAEALRVGTEVLEPVRVQLELLQQREQQLQQLQYEQAAIVAQLEASLTGTRGDLLSQLAQDHSELVQAIEELQVIVSEDCIKTDQLGQIFAARDNMYGAWLKMQAVFDANKSRGRMSHRVSSAGLLSRMPPSRTISSHYETASEGGTPAAAAQAGNAGLHAQLAAEPGGVSSSSRLTEQPRSGTPTATAALAEALIQTEFDPFSELVAAASPASSPLCVSPSPYTTSTAATAAAAAAVTPADFAAVMTAQQQLQQQVGGLATQVRQLLARVSQQVGTDKPSTYKLASGTVGTSGAAVAPGGATAFAAQSMAAMAEQIAQLQQDLLQLKQTLVSSDAATGVTASSGRGSNINSAAAAASTAQDAAAAASNAGVLHAPLSVVVQLQQEVDTLKGQQVSKDQLAAVVRMVRELKESSSEGSAAGSADGVAAISKEGFAANAQLLQQYEAQLEALKQAVAILQQQITAAEVVAADATAGQQRLQQQIQDACSATATQQQLIRDQQQAIRELAAVQQTSKKQGANIAAAAASTQQQVSGFEEQVTALQTTGQHQKATMTAVVNSTQQAVIELSSQQGSMKTGISKLSVLVSDLSDHVAAATSGASQAVGQVITTTEELQARLSALEQQQKQLVAEQRHHHQQQRQQQEAFATAWPSAGGKDTVRVGRTVSGSGLAGVAVAAVDAEATAVDRVASTSQPSNTDSRRVSHVTSLTEQDAAEVTAAAVSEVSQAIAGPMQLVHQILMQLKKRVDKLEATAAAAAPAAAATAAVAAPAAAAATSRGPAPATVRRGSAWLQPLSDAATLEELQDMVVRLQQDVARIDAESTSFGAALLSIRGDVGAAAAAAAAAVFVRESPAAVHWDATGDAGLRTSSIVHDAAVIRDEVATAMAAAHTAACDAAQAQQVAAAAQDSLRALTGDLQLLQDQLAVSKHASQHDSAADAAEFGVSDDMQRAITAEVAKASDALAAELQVLKATVQELAGNLQASADAAKHVTVMRQEALLLRTEVQDAKLHVVQMEESIGQEAAAAAGIAATTAAELQGIQEQLIQVKQQLQELQADKASEANAAAADNEELQQAITVLQAELQYLSSQVTRWSPRTASASMSVASSTGGSSGVIEEVQSLMAKQLADLQSQLDALQAVVTAQQQQQQQPLQAQSVTATADNRLQSSELSFDTLAAVPMSTTELGLARQLLAATVQEVQPLPAVAQGDSVAAATATGARLPAVATDEWFDAADAFSSAGCAASAAGVPTGAIGAAQADGGKHIQGLLRSQLGMLSPEHQVAFISRLAGVVLAHAARLLVTYQDDPVLSAQLRQSRQELAALTAGAASPAAAMAGSTSFARSPSSITASRRQDAGSPAAAAATPAAASPGEALLGILDQVASLRAISSATHPAIIQALQKHEAQISALLAAHKQLKEQQQQTSFAGAATQGGEGGDGSCGYAADPTQGSISSDSVGFRQGSSSNSQQRPRHEQVSSTAAASPSDTHQPPAPAAATADGTAVQEQFSQRLSVLESRLTTGLKAVSALLRDKLGPLQEVADATQSMMRELQVAHGIVLQRLEALESLAASGVVGHAQREGGAAADGDNGNEVAAGALAVAGSLRKLQDDVLGLSRRISTAEAKLSSAAEGVALSHRLAARLADTDDRNALLAGKVSGVASTLPVLLQKVAELEARLSRSIGIARRGLDILADQLVALGALRASPTKNPLAALGPNHAAITALEGKVEAVRTAMTASVKLMMQELAADAATAGSVKAAPGLNQADLGASLVALQVAANEAVTAATTSHVEALNGLESQIAELRMELLATVTAAVDNS